MGAVASKLNKLIGEIGSSHPRRVLMLGLDAAGKTTILYKLKLNECVNTIPTIGFNVEEVKVGKGLTFTMWDVGGQEKIRPLWKHYMTDCQALIYVVDSSDSQRLTEARDELFTIAGLEEMMGVPVIIIANKQDLPHARTTSQIADKLELRKLERNHKWHLQACCAISGEGLYEAMGHVGRMSTEFIKSKGK